MRVQFLVGAALLASGTASKCEGGCPSWPDPPAKAPRGAKNVLFFAVDDFRPESEVLGGVPGTPMPKMHTPNIDRLAAQSLVLTKNYVQQAVCSPTRQSILTGRRPDRTRVYDLQSYFREVGGNYTTIPQFFRMNGYNTTGMGKIFHPGHAAGMGTVGGDNDFCCSWSHDTVYYSPAEQKYNQSWVAVDKETEAKQPIEDKLIAQHAVETLGSLRKTRASGDDRPFFMAVGFHKPHLPFVASQKYFDLYPLRSIQLPYNQQPPKDMPDIAWSGYGELRAYSDQENATGQAGTVLPEKDVLELRRAYYASVSQTDDMIGRVLDALERTGEAHDTIISFWGDHGWQLGEHGEWCKHTNFEFATRAPMMIRVPGLTDGGIITKQYTEHVDLFPTLTEAAVGTRLDDCPAGDESFSVALCAEGTSLVSLMRSPNTPLKIASFSQYPRAYQTPESTGKNTELSSAVSGGVSPCITETGNGCTMGVTMVTSLYGHEYRYTEWADFNTEGFSKRINFDRIVGVELYNHSADAGENANIENADTVHASLVSELSKILRAGPDAARLPPSRVIV